MVLCVFYKLMIKKVSGYVNEELTITLKNSQKRVSKKVINNKFGQ